PVRVGADVRVVAEIRARVHVTGIRAVVGYVDLVDVPAARRVTRLAHRQVEVVHAGEDTLAGTINLRVERHGEDEEPLRLRVEDARRVAHGRAADLRRAVDRGRVAVERVQVDRVVNVPREAAHDVGGGVVRQQRRSGRGAVDVEDVVDDLDDIAVADAHALVGRLDGELVPAARIALLVVVQALEAGVERRVRLRLLSARDRRAATGPRGEADRPALRVR